MNKSSVSLISQQQWHNDGVAARVTR